jgi:hypothetical protein
MMAVMKKGDDVKDGDMRRTTFTVEGMDCADEVRLIEDKLGRLPSVENPSST